MSQPAIRSLRKQPAWLTRHKADFTTKCRLIRERVDSRESETLGKWLTSEGLRKTGNYTASMIKSIISYCKKFPETMVRLGL